MTGSIGPWSNELGPTVFLPEVTWADAVPVHSVNFEFDDEAGLLDGLALVALVWERGTSGDAGPAVWESCRLPL